MYINTPSPGFSKHFVITPLLCSKYKNEDVEKLAGGQKAKPWFGARGKDPRSSAY